MTRRFRSLLLALPLAAVGCADGGTETTADAGVGAAPPPPGQAPPNKPPAPGNKPPPNGAPAPGAPPEQPPPPEEDGCRGVGPTGACDGDTAYWCQDGELRNVDCGNVGEQCGWVSDDVGYYCGGDPAAGPGAPPPGPPPGDPAPGDPAPPPADPQGCGDIDYLGACDGDVALYCHEGELGRVDCARWDQPCGWVDDDTGYYCGGMGERPAPPPREDPAPPPADPPPRDDPPGAPPPDDPPGAPPPDDPPPGEDPPPRDDPAPDPRPDPQDPGGCDGVDYQGRCDGDVAEWCDDDGEVQRLDCRDARNVGCGWVDEDAGFFCGGEGDGPGDGGRELPDDQPPEGGPGDEPPDDRPPPPNDPAPEDPPDEDPPGAPPPNDPPPDAPPPEDPPNEDPCDGLDYLGRCDGDVARWCDNGQPRSVDCSSRGERCGFVDDETGWYCGGDPEQPRDPEEDPPEGAPPPEDPPEAPPPQDPPEEEDPDPAPDPPEDDQPEDDQPEDDPCAGIDYLGACEGTVAVWCDNGQVNRRDCADTGQSCGWLDENSGYWCGGAGERP